MDTGDALLRVADHLPEEICEAGLAQLLRAAAVQGAVVDGLAAGGVAEARLDARCFGCQGRLGGLGGCHFAWVGKEGMCGFSLGRHMKVEGRGLVGGVEMGEREVE